MREPQQEYDVVIAGYGPVGMVLAALLGRAGRRVAVVERYPGLYHLPRAACFDHEIMRTFQKLGRAADVAEGAVAQHNYEWCNADGEVLVDIIYDDPAPTGWPEQYMMYQPHLEGVLDATVQGLANIDVFQGSRVVDIDQDQHGVTVQAVGPGEQQVVLRSTFAVGADGGESFVRGALGIATSSYGFEENWLVCDFRKMRTLDIPEFRQICDPAQPASIVRIGPHHHRFSFMLDPGARSQDVTAPDHVWQRVAEYVTPRDAELIRAANYRFRSRIAERWRDHRILLAGDAAHEMPPFLGQGMCSGIRDAHNLSWKLDLVLGGRASADVLDTYQREREPHVRAITEKAIELGRVQTLRDPEAARLRDAELLRRRATSGTPEKLRFPPYATGVLAAHTPGAGELFIQGRVRAGDASGLFDDVVGPGPVLITTTAAEAGEAGSTRLSAFRELGGHVAVIDDGQRDPSTDAERRLEDQEGAYAGWLARHDSDSVLVRPDWYVFGAAVGPDGPARLIDQFIAQLTAGVGAVRQ